jgi:hypothetical protein
MDFFYYWVENGQTVVSTNRKLADHMLHSGIQVFLQPIHPLGESVGGNDEVDKHV